MRGRWSVGAGLVLAVVLGAGCDEEVGAAAAPAEGSREAVALLRALSYPGTSRDVLAVEAGVPVGRAARLVAWRDGGDGRPGTADDQRFRSVEGLAGVTGFDGGELGRLAHWALERGWDDGDEAWVGSFEGVGFNVFAAEVTLDLVNGAPIEVLDGDVGLRSDAVASIVAARPLGSVAELAALPRVGPTHLERLRGFAVAEAERAAILAQ